MADYSSPKPVDPIWYQPGAWLNIQCGCGRNENYSLRDFARLHRLNKNMLLHQLIERLRCIKCGERPRFADVTRYKGSNR